MPGHEARGRSSRTDPGVGQRLDRPPHVVDPAPVRAARRRAGGPGRRTSSRAHVPLEVGQVAAGHLDGLLLVGAEDIDDPVRHLHRHRPDLLRAVHAEPAALDHGRATHADVGVGSGDDDVAAAEHAACRRNSLVRHDPDQGHLAAQGAE